MAVCRLRGLKSELVGGLRYLRSLVSTSRSRPRSIALMALWRHSNRLPSGSNPPWSVSKTQGWKAMGLDKKIQGCVVAPTEFQTLHYLSELWSQGRTFVLPCTEKVLTSSDTVRSCPLLSFKSTLECSADTNAWKRTTMESKRKKALFHTSFHMFRCRSLFHLCWCGNVHFRAHGLHVLRFWM